MLFEGDYFVKNRSIVSNTFVDEVYEQQVYEVIRFNDGIPLFHKEHFCRFISSCNAANISVEFSESWLAEVLLNLAKKNGVKNSNLKYFINKKVGGFDFYAGFIPSSYPTAEQYAKGVRVGLLFEERSTPNAKILNLNLRLLADEMIAREDLFEVALVNKMQQITEGSRSNLFFVDIHGKVTTAPLKQVLGGITREIVIEEIHQLGIELLEEAMCVENLSRYASAFISGTSPGVLPIASIGGISFEPESPIAKQIASRYQLRVRADREAFLQHYHL